MEIRDQQVSVLGSHYLGPVATLIEELRALPPSHFKDELPLPKEAGLAAAICILSTVAFESWVRKLMLMADRDRANDRRHALTFLSVAYPSFPTLASMYEVFVLRDLLVHNHIWEIHLGPDDTYDLAIMAASRVPGGEDKKYKNYVDPSTARTRHLGLHVIPTQVARRDASIVLRTVWDSLLWLQANTDLLMMVDHYHLVRGGKKVYFATYVTELEQDAQPRQPAGGHPGPG